MTLSVPARSEALGIVRIVLMSCGAAAGVRVDELMSSCNQVADAFTSVLVSLPEATNIVIRTQTGVGDVDMETIDDLKARRS